ncbi:MAG: hypothetical protein ABH875_04100 [Candidatus Omnitrophota bacterium]
MKSLVRLFIFMGLVALVAGVAQKFFSTAIIFGDIKPLSHLVFANSCFLIALILKLAND